jgi:hypothetical protein
MSDFQAIAGSAPGSAPGAAEDREASFADPASGPRLERAAAALTEHGFTVEILDDAAAARTRVNDLIPEGASVFTAASETLRLSGIDEDINTGGWHDAVSYPPAPEAPPEGSGSSGRRRSYPT